MTVGIKKMYFRNLSLTNNKNKSVLTLNNIIEQTDDINYNNLLTKVNIVEDKKEKNKIKINEIKNVNNKLYLLE